MVDRSRVDSHDSSQQKLDNQPSHNLYGEDASKANPNSSSKEFGAVQEDGTDHGSLGSVKEVFDIQAVDPVLAKKMALVNEAIDEIGMTRFQWKLFFLNGFGYAVDSVTTFLPRNIKEFVLTLQRVSAPDCVPIDCKSGCTASIWTAQCSYCWDSSSIASWPLGWCCHMGLFGRYHRSKACFQYQPVWLCYLRLDCWRNAVLYLHRRNVGIPPPIDEISH